MRKIILVYIAGLTVGFCFSQTGINTKTPQGAFHIDAKGDTNGSSNTSDDVVVDSNGNIGIGTINPQVKFDIQATGGAGFRMNDGTADKGKIIVSDSEGNFSWGVRPSPDQRKGNVIQISTSPTASTTTAPNLRNTPTTVPGAVKITDSSMELTEGTWLIQLKYTTRTTSGAGTGAGRFGTGCGSGFNFYIWTMIYDETTSQVVTTVGTPQEKNGYCMSTPQVSYVIKIPAGEKHTISAYGSTSTSNNVVVYVNNDITNFNFGAPYFVAIRLDTFN